MKQISMFDNLKEEKKVIRIKRDDTKDFILNKHYAGRMPPISYAYGLYINNELVGVCTIGKPASYTLCNGICGKDYSKHVYELNRLITLDGLDKNALSYFVGQVLKDLKQYNLILVSFADTKANHCGYIYQATNWVYTGKTKRMYDYYTPGGKHQRHGTNKEEFKHLRRIRSEKHRYIYFACDKTHKKEYVKNFKYNIVPEYPKEKNKKYVLGTRMKEKIINKNTNEVFYE